MEFPFFISSVVPVDEDGYSVITSEWIRQQLGVKIGQDYSLSVGLHKLTEIINTIGQYSQKAQKLSYAITSARRLTSENQRIYLLSNKKKVIGFIKTGKKTLFHRDMSGKITEITPQCVLDFYVHFGQQRKGYGRV